MNRIFIGCPLVLAALFLTFRIQAQQPAAQPAVAASSQADYQWTSAIADNAMVGTHKAVLGSIRTVGPVAFNDNAEVAFLAEWPDGARGIYTRSGRAVIEEGANINGTVVEHVLNTAPGNILLDPSGRVAYVATIRGKGCFSATCTGLFLEKSLTAILAGGTAAFQLSETGQIQTVPGAAWYLPAQSAPGSNGGGLAEIRKRIKLPPIPFRVPWSPVPVVIDPNTPAGGQTQAQQAAQGPQLAQFPAAPTLANCTLPPGNQYPFPKLWGDGANAAGPVGTMASEPGMYGQFYRSVAQVPATNFSRKVFFAKDCRPLIVAVTPLPGSASVELWTPAGILAAFDPTKGTYHFEGAGEAVLPPSSSPIENGIRINRSCRVLVPVTLRKSSGEEPALIIGTPTKPGHCPAE